MQSWLKENWFKIGLFILLVIISWNYVDFQKKELYISVKKAFIECEKLELTIGGTYLCENNFGYDIWKKWGLDK